ncbi:hypothetical protein A2316_03825 [Candidatus Falkowbacteria bacterium RIFOXYB2_FULL_38_15]|uniref:Uncharacterized protein n=1 Tax=Candidatus Falkowbacteria bacterium RIFOXYA2_FULL_38_12 TaxID=1797993 RepID=A0A1F5S1T3_9BACT|nr:MAG: hypothetical protein A2257_01280 [Candidatus Falkowbacteria bacterium RIFOXYA2_FULL_38_12]OGF32588.1 MAG: hypothetical protein A2316_03825 [Candidatus Falkowbacteria bacterium RIFOXYB2_FULL_38_15]OGF42110.1 MAG: hypothetical protein A2555_03330 [Candidatus Falkowbacteria bacterium RIFOXYD2_FULL_39_16]
MRDVRNLFPGEREGSTEIDPTYEDEMKGAERNEQTVVMRAPEAQKEGSYYQEMGKERAQRASETLKKGWGWLKEKVSSGASWLKGKVEKGAYGVLAAPELYQDTKSEVKRMAKEGKEKVVDTYQVKKAEIRDGASRKYEGLKEAGLGLYERARDRVNAAKDSFDDFRNEKRREKMERDTILKKQQLQQEMLDIDAQKKSLEVRSSANMRELFEVSSLLKDLRKPVEKRRIAEQKTRKEAYSL